MALSWNFIDAAWSARYTVVQDTVHDYGASGLADVATGADGGNPMSSAFSGAVRLSDGIVNYPTTDFSVPGPGFARAVARFFTDQSGSSHQSVIRQRRDHDPIALSHSGNKRDYCYN